MTDSTTDQAPPTRVVRQKDISRELSSGTRVDRYEIAGTLGSGGCGVVYAARHVHLEKTVALKLLHRNLVHSEEAVERFFREARAAAAVGSPHIVRVLDCGSSMGGQPFLAMEFLKGVTLSSLLDGGQRLELERAVDISIQTLEGLAAAAEVGIVHRDLKPGNIFVTRHPETGEDFVKLLDFGVSKFHQSAYEKALTGTGALLGTPRYMAPEQFKGAHNVDQRADLFAASVVLYQMIAGRLPFEGDTPIELAHRATTDPPLPLLDFAPDVPQELWEVILCGLEKEPEDRWSTALVYADALRKAMHIESDPDDSGQWNSDEDLRTVQDLSDIAEAAKTQADGLVESAVAASLDDDDDVDTEDSGSSLPFNTLPGLGGNPLIKEDLLDDQNETRLRPSSSGGSISSNDPAADYEDPSFRTVPGDLSSDELLNSDSDDTNLPTVKAEQISLEDLEPDTKRSAPIGHRQGEHGDLEQDGSGLIPAPNLLGGGLSYNPQPSRGDNEVTVPRGDNPLTPDEIAGIDVAHANRADWIPPAGEVSGNLRESGPLPEDLWKAAQSSRFGAADALPSQPAPPVSQPDQSKASRPRWVFWVIFALVVALGGLLFGTIVGLGVVAAGFLD